MLTLLQAGGLNSANGNAQAVRVLLVVGLLIVVVVAFGLFVLQFRKRLLNDEGADGSQPLLLEDLRAMARRGEISEQEFEAMRRRMVEKLSGRSVGSLSTSGAAGAAPIKSRASPEKGLGRTGGGTGRAAPGVDLTGDPLPNPDRGE